MSLCSVSANCSRLRCKTSCSTDARLSNVVHSIVSLQFAILLHFASFFHRVVASASCLGPLDHSPCSMGLSPALGSGGCSSCALLCAAQRCMSACRTRVAANPGGPQGGAQTGRRWGGAGGKLSQSGSETNDAQWRAPTDGAPTGSVASERTTPCGHNFPMQRMITNQEQQNKYPCYRIRDTQSL